jgi:uncharacterized membrane protein
MDLKRIGRHLLADQRTARRLFPARTLAQLEQATRHGEQLHRGQVRLAIEASLALQAARAGVTPRQRAIEVFSQLRLWDTDNNSGVLVYLLIADRAVEIVADRGIAARVDPAVWQGVCRKMEARFRAGDYAEGARSGLVEIGALLALHFPRRAGASPAAADNEVPDAPVIL